MAEAKRYIKYGLATGSGLLALTALYFSTSVWREQQAESPHYRAGACGVCHAGEPSEGVLVASSEIELCQSCHQKETHGIIKVDQKDIDTNGIEYVRQTITVDLGISHPYGVRADKHWPRTLPVKFGHITCQTCHDVHQDNVDSNMLRLGSENNYTPLCHDCHKEY